MTELVVLVLPSLPGEIARDGRREPGRDAVSATPQSGGFEGSSSAREKGAEVDRLPVQGV